MGLIETTKERGDKNNEDCGKTESDADNGRLQMGPGLGDRNRKEVWGGSRFT